MTLPRSFESAIQQSRDSETPNGRRFACTLLALALDVNRAVEELGPEIGATFSRWLAELDLHPQLAAEAFDQLNSAAPRAIMTDIYYQFGIWLEKRGQLLSAVTQQRTALLIDDAHIPARRALGRLSGEIADSWHFAMLNDRARNSSFISAIKRKLSNAPGKYAVLDLGSGTGLLGIAAESAGANRTTCLEFNQPLAELAAQIAEANESNLSVVPKLSTAYKTDQRYGCLVTEIFDCSLLGEDAIRSILDAHQRLIAPGATVIPRRARMYVQPAHIENPALRPFTVNNVTLGAPAHSRRKPNRGDGAEPYEGERLADLSTKPRLGERVPLMSVDFTVKNQLQTIVNQPEQVKVQLEMPDGDINAAVVTFELDLDENDTIDNRVGNQGCWEQAVFPFKHNLGHSVNATFRLECDGPILERVEGEVGEVDIFIPGRQIAAYRNRTEIVADLVSSENYLVWYTSNLDADIVGAALNANKKIVVVYHTSECEKNFDKLHSLLNCGTRVRRGRLDDELILILPDGGDIPFYVNFLDRYQLIHWSLMGAYLDGRIGHHDLPRHDIKITLSYQLCFSKWIEDRVLLDDDNIPDGIEIANHLNSLQLVDYPEFDTWADHHNALSETKTIELIFNKNNRKIEFESQLDFESELTSVRFWATVKHGKLELPTQKCHYILRGLINVPKRSTHRLKGTISLQTLSHCPDNCGISFSL